MGGRAGEGWGVEPMSDYRPCCALIAPFRDRTQEDYLRLEAAKRHVLGLGLVPLFLPDTLRWALNDHVAGQREEALACSEGFLATIARDPSSSFLVVPRVDGSHSEGMVRDLLCVERFKRSWSTWTP